MSPRYKDVVIPAEQREAFRAFLATINGNYQEEMLSETEKVILADPEWKRQIAEARELLAQFVHPRDPQVSRKISQNFISLIRRVFAGQNQGEQFAGSMRLDIDWFATKEAVITLLEANLPHEIPATAIVLPLRTGGFGFRMKEPDDFRQPIPLSPRAIGAIILSHGLHNGAPLTETQGAKALGMQRENYGKAQKAGYKALRLNQGLQELVLSR